MRIEEEQSLSSPAEQLPVSVRWCEGWMEEKLLVFWFWFYFFPPNNNNNKKRHFSQTLRATSSLEWEENLLTPQPSPSLYLWPNQILYSFYFWKICYFRTTEISSQHHCGAEICKYVFGSVPVTVFSWCFLFLLVCFSFLPPPHHPNSQDFKFFNPTFGRKRREEKKTVCKSFRIFQRD